MRMAKKFLGIDIGGTKIHALVRQDSKIVWRETVKTPHTSREKFLKALNSIIQSVVGDLHIAGVGIGVPSPIGHRGILTPAHIPALSGFNLGSYVERLYKVEARVENDAQCFTWGEYLYGAAKRSPNVVGITLGTGIGGGWVVGGYRYNGWSGSALEIGHICCGDVKEFETLASTTYVRERGGHEAREVLALAEAGDSGALEVYAGMADNLAHGLATIVNILNPHTVVVGGGLMHAKKFFFERAVQGMRAQVFSHDARKVKVVASALMDDAGAMGASALFLDAV